MSKILIHRTNVALPHDLDGARDLLFNALDGFGDDDKKAWRKLWKRIIGLAPGEMLEISTVFPRSGPFHRLHMSLEQKLFDSQEQFTDREVFRTWLKLGSGWVIWAPGSDGAMIPIPKSISFAAADEVEFRQYHDAVLEFLRGPRAAEFLWPHLEDKAVAQIEYILRAYEG